MGDNTKDRTLDDIIEDLRKQVDQTGEEIENKINKLNSEFDSLVQNINSIKNREPNEKPIYYDEDVQLNLDKIDNQNEMIEEDHKISNENNFNNANKNTINDAISKLDKIITENNNKKSEEITQEYKPIINDEISVEGKRIGKDDTLIETLLNINGGIEINTNNVENKEEIKTDELEKADDKRIEDIKEEVKEVEQNVNDARKDIVIKPRKLNYSIKEIVDNLHKLINEIKPLKSIVKYQEEKEETNKVEIINEAQKQDEDKNKIVNEDKKEFVFAPANHEDNSKAIITILKSILDENAINLPRTKVSYKEEPVLDNNDSTSTNQNNQEVIAKENNIVIDENNDNNNKTNELDDFNLDEIINEIEKTINSTTTIDEEFALKDDKVVNNNKENEKANEKALINENIKVEQNKKEINVNKEIKEKKNNVKEVKKPKPKKVVKPSIPNANKPVKNIKDKIMAIFKKKNKKVMVTKNDDNNSNNKPKRPEAKKITMVFAVIAIIVVILEIAGFVGAYLFASKLCEGMPEFSPADLDSADSTIIYDSEGNQVMELGLYLRENIEHDDIPNCVTDAFISIEDSRFYEHFGFDIPRFTKAIIENLKSKSFGQGGSTFTMQLVKISYFQTDAGEDSTMAAREGISGVQRKMQEIVLALQAEQRLSKEEILVLYLNKLNFGDNIRGIQKAAEYYFGKDASELNLNEAAFLAGIINAPNGNNPYNAAYGNTEYLDNANARKNEVLDLMVYHGYITEEEAKLNKAVKIEDLLAGKQSKFAETNQYYQSFIDAVINEAERVTGKNPYLTAMNIYTSMDPYMQEYVYNMQNNPEMFDKYIFRHDNQQNALVVLNNQTGELVALGGGRNQADEARQFNRAIDSYINPGSSIKPVLEYVLAFDRLGYATSHTICDRPIFLYETDIAVTNAYGQGYTGDMQITEALARSLNTPAIQLLEEVIEKYDDDGEEVIKYCNAIGFDWCNKDTFDIQWAIGGRDCLVSPVQLAAAHGMLMHEGKYIAPHTIKKIEFRGKYNETPDYIADTEGTQVVSKAAAFMTAYCERYNVTSGWINQLNLLRRDYPTYGKTGTTNFSEEAYEAYNIPETAAKDQWLCTQTSNYTIVVWNGFDKVDSDSFFTVTDENYNLKCKMGSLLLDATMDHFNYDAKEIEKPDDCIEIQHLLGCFPYAIGSSAKGYIKKDSEYATPVPASTIEKERVGGTLYHMAAKPTEEGMMLHWDEFNSYLEDGRVDLTITSVSGKVTIFATGRSYYQRYNFIKPDVFYATITASSGEVVNVESPVPTTISEVAGEGPYTVCGWTSANPRQACTVK